MQGPDTDAQDHPLHLFTSGLQRTAGPYRRVKSDAPAISALLPLYPSKVTFIVRLGMSQGATRGPKDCCIRNPISTIAAHKRTSGTACPRR
jgi:hypothetical protein